MTTVYGLLLPGMTLNATIFPVFPFPTLSVDFNKHPPQPSGGPHLMADYVAELTSRLTLSREWNEAQRRIVIAHSFGGMLAQSWLLDGDETARSVDRLILVGTTAGPMYDVVRLKLARVGGREFRVGIGGLMHVWNSTTVTKAVKRLMTGGSLAVREVDFRAIARPTDLRIDFAGWRNTAWRAMQSYRRAMDGFDTRDRLSAVTLPTIVMHGSDDSLFRPEAGKDIADRIPNAEFRKITGARHVLPLTHGQLVIDAARDLLDM